MNSEHYWHPTPISNNPTPYQIWIVTFNTTRWPNRPGHTFPTFGIIDIHTNFPDARASELGWLVHRWYWRMRKAVAETPDRLANLAAEDRRNLDEGWRFASREHSRRERILQGHHWSCCVEVGEATDPGYEIVEVCAERWVAP